MTIQEFARYCGVSPATVSRYFSGVCGVSPAVSERIRTAAKETGYCPSPEYQRRKKGGNGLVAVILPLWNHRFFMDILEALGTAAGEEGKNLAVLGANEDLLGSKALISRLAPEGIILLDETEENPLVHYLQTKHIPVVVCSALSLSRRFPCVHIDDLGAAYDGTNYLIDLGHREIAVISDRPHAISSGFQRVTGCRKALEDAGLMLEEKNIVYAGNSFDDGYQGMRILMERGCTATAVFAFSDAMAAGAMAALRDAGKSIPEDISVLGFDDCSLALETRPRLTTVHQPIDQMARRSLHQLSCKEGAESITLPHTLTVRDSCRPPSAG